MDRTTIDEDELHPVDRDAFERAIIACRARDAMRAEQIDAMLADRPWEEVGKFCGYSEQIDNLGLEPWQNPPCAASLFDLALPFGDASAARESAEVLRDLKAAGLSVYEPDPRGALERAGADMEAKAKRAIEDAVARSKAMKSFSSL